MGRTLSSRPLLVFLHLPKTGGITLLDIIKRQYGQRAVLTLYDSAADEELAALSVNARMHLRVVTGHLYFGIHASLPQPATYVTLLRDPVDRVISHYYFVQTEPGHYLYERAHGLSLADYVMCCGFDEPNNDQTRLLAGNRFAAAPWAHPDEMLAAAKQNLLKHFAVVGLTEEFDRSLLLMQGLFGWRRPFYRRHNATRERPRKEEMPAATLRVIEAYNELDLELYSFGKTLFYEQLSRLEEKVEAALRTFRMLNRSYGKLRLTWAAAVARVMVGQ